MTKTVLLVEDAEDNRGLIREVFEDYFAGVTLVEAPNGAEGLHLARTLHPDLVLLDLSLPQLSGWEVAATLKSDPATAPIPLLALTAHAMAGDEQRARDAGCDGYMAKPFAITELLAVLERYVPRDDS